jgi:hypothetical protein
VANQPLIRLVHRGTLAAGQTFSWRLTTQAPNTLSQSDLNTWLSSVKTAFDTMYTSSTGLRRIQAPTDQYNQLQAYFMNTGSDKAVTSSTIADTSNGFSTRTLPFQCSLVVSLRTVIPGPKGRGRVYLPISNTNDMSAGQVTSSALTPVSSGFVTYIRAINALSIGGQNTVVVIVNPLTSAVPAAVSTVIVDSVVDTQQRRRDKIGASAVVTTTV